MKNTKMCSILYYSVEEDENYQQAYYAYLMIFDANNRKERKELLNKIIFDPHISVLFWKNCNPNDEEMALAFDSIGNDIDSTFLFLKECKPEGYYRNEAMKILLCVDDFAYMAAKNCELDSNEVKEIYKKFSERWSETNNLQEYFDYCKLFQQYLTNEEVETLINMVYENQDEIIAEYIITNDFKLSDSQIDKLESLFIIKKLKGEQNETINS